MTGGVTSTPSGDRVKEHEVNRFTAVVAAVAIAAGAAACTSKASTSTSGGAKSLTLGALTDVRSFDPAKEENGHQVQYLEAVYDTLLHRKPDGTLEPGLATAWTFSPDRLTLTLDLRKDAKFADGTAVDAKAVVASFERFAKANGPRAAAMAVVSKYTATTDSQVTLTLSQPDPGLLTELTLTAGMVVNPKDADSDKLTTAGSGSGPYVLDTAATTKSDHYTFVRSKNYYDAKAYPYDKIVIRVLTDATARMNALLSGQVDAAFGGAAGVTQAQSAGLQVIKSQGDWQGLFLVDRQGKVLKPLGDVRVRRAINHAIDGDAILKNVMKGFGTPTTQIFSPTSAAYDPSLDDRYPYDPAKAKALLAEAGYPNGFTLPMPQPPILTELFPVIKQQLAAVGIKVAYTATTPAEGLTPYFSGKYPAFAFSWGASDPWVDAIVLASKAGSWNVLKVDDPQITNLMGQVAMADGAAQADAYKKLSAYLVDQAWFDPWYILDNLYFAKKTVHVEPQAQQVIPDLDNFTPQA